MKFEATVERLNDHWIVRIPGEVSRQFPSRGMLMAEVEMKNQTFQAPLEPDGKGSHWLELQDQLQVEAGEKIAFELHVLEAWTEPDVPEDLSEILAQEELESAWQELTIKARWEWIRWIRSTKNPQTRRKRIGVATDKLHRGDRRPCCFNSASCTVPELSKSGILLEKESK